MTSVTFCKPLLTSVELTVPRELKKEHHLSLRRRHLRSPSLRAVRLEQSKINRSNAVLTGHQALWLVTYGYEDRHVF